MTSRNLLLSDSYLLHTVPITSLPTLYVPAVGLRMFTASPRNYNDEYQGPLLDGDEKILLLLIFAHPTRGRGRLFCRPTVPYLLPTQAATCPPPHRHTAAPVAAATRSRGTSIERPVPACRHTAKKKLHNILTALALAAHGTTTYT